MLADAAISAVHWTVFVVAVLFFLALDLGVFHRHAHVVRLREALTSHGFGGVSVDISQQSFADRPMAQSSMQRWESWQALAPDGAAVDRMPAARWASRGQLDAYA